MAMKLKHNEILSVAKHIINTYRQGKQKFEDYLVHSLAEISNALEGKYYEDDLLEYLCEGEGYKKLTSVLGKIIERDLKTYHTQKIKLTRELCFDYIESTNLVEHLNNGNRQWLIEKLVVLETLEEKTKGDIYEKFCTLFFKDIGFDVVTTRSSNDAGVDIIGKISLPFDNSVVYNFLGRSGVHIISQVKFHSTPVDTPVVRHIIADSIFYRFKGELIGIDQGEIPINNHPAFLCLISHKGFTKEAAKFGKSNGIVLLDSERIVDILCSMGDWDSLSSVSYIKDQLD